MPLKPNPGSRWRPLYNQMFELSLVGIEMGAAVGIGVGIGYYLDYKLIWTKPGLTLFFMALGLAAAGKALYGAVLEMRAKLRASDREKEDGPS